MARNTVRLRKMADQRTSPEARSGSPVQPVSSRPRAGKIAWAAFIAAAIGVVLTWYTTFAGPVAAREAAARFDYANIYTVAAIGWGIVTALNLIAVILGARGICLPYGKALSGAAVGIGATGILGFLANLYVSFQILPGLG